MVSVFSTRPEPPRWIGRRSGTAIGLLNRQDVPISVHVRASNSPEPRARSLPLTAFCYRLARLEHIRASSHFHQSRSPFVARTSIELELTPQLARQLCSIFPPPRRLAIPRTARAGSESGCLYSSESRSRCSSST
jgi:hypothetical protein